MATSSPAEYQALNQLLQTLIETLIEQVGESSGPITDERSPAALLAALEQFREVLVRVTADRASGSAGGATDADLTELGEYGIELLDQLQDWARRRPDEGLQAQAAEALVSFAAWLAEQGGELLTLEPVVNTLAWLANSTREPAVLARLCGRMARIQSGVVPVLQRDLESANPARPWRLLILNRAIVATRSQDCGLMEAAFDDLVQRLPEDAPAFFAQGMEQVRSLPYPAQVRRLMEHYYDRWKQKPAVH